MGLKALSLTQPWATLVETMKDQKPRVWNRRNKDAPKGAVYVGRPSRWGNPFKIGSRDCEHPDCAPGSHGITTREQAIERYRDWLCGMLKVAPDYVAPLRGKHLVCWCAPLSCHADVLMEVANR